MNKSQKIIWIIALVVVIVLIGVVGYGYFQKLTKEVKNPVATMEVENFGTVKMELYPDQAPESVANFIALANRGYYDGSTFHRVVKDFMIQGGTKNGDGSTGAKLSDLKDGGEDKEYSIKGEFIANGVNNKIKFEEGILGMARSDFSQYSSDLTTESYNSGNAQFFIMTKENTSLNGNYTSFGKVTEGMDVVHNLENIEVKAPDDAESTGNTEVSTPVNAPKITSIRVETFGVDYGMPETLTPFDYMSWMYKQYGIGGSTSTNE